MRRLAVSLVAGMLLLAAGAQPLRPLRVMEWNVENLFDTVHDEGFADEAFLPTGEYRWTSGRYWRKLKDVARVMAAAGEEGGLPDLVGFCEVENDSVLTALTRRSPLRLLGYEYVMTHGEDARGIDVALMYHPARFRLLDNRSIRVPSREHGLRPTRDFLHVRGLVRTAGGTDTLHVLVVHLPSRVGGRPGDRNRKLAAQTLWAVADSLFQTSAKVLIMGDFNASPRDPVFRRDRLYRRLPLRLTDDLHAPGSYCFRGFWQWIDHILLSPGIQATEPARPLRLPWLLEDNQTYGGQMPRRTFRGPVYHGGVSDHLPLLLDITL